MIDNIKFATTTVGNFGTKVSNFSNKENANMTKANISKAKGDLWKKEEFFEGLQPNTGRGYSTWRPFLRNDFFFLRYLGTFVVNEISSVTNLFAAKQINVFDVISNSLRTNRQNEGEINLKV